MAPPSRQSFVGSLAPIAQQWQQRTGIPVAVWLAMAASESNWGNAGNSLFGIKGKGNAGSQNSPTWESVNGQRVNTSADFADYKNPNDAFQGFWDLVSQSPRYAEALTHLPNDPAGFLHGINQAGYATDPSWAHTILNSARQTITPMMGQMQDSTGASTAGGDPEIDALYKAAGYEPDVAPTGQAGNATGTYGPPAPAGMGEDGTPQSGVDGNAILRAIQAKKGAASVARINPTTIKGPGDDYGSATVPNPVIINRYTWPDATYLDVVSETDKTAYIKGGNAIKVLQTGMAAAVRTWTDGSLRQEDTSEPVGSDARWKIIAPAPTSGGAGKPIRTARGEFEPNIDAAGNKTWTLIPGTEPPGARLQIQTMPDGSLQSHDPDTNTWTMIQPRYVDPAEAAYKSALTGEANANTASKIRGMRSTAQAAVEDAYPTIAAIQKQLADGSISPKDAASMVDQVHKGVAAAIAGTTLFEQQKLATETQTQRATAASNFLQQRIQSGASLGASLFNSATGHVLMPAGQSSLGIDPMAIANEEVNAMGGGAATGDAAGAFLRAALQGQQQGGGGDQGGGGPPLTGANGQPLHGVFPASAIGPQAQGGGDTFGPLEAPGSAQGNWDATGPIPFAQSGLSEGRSVAPTTQMAQVAPMARRIPIPPPLGRG